MPGRTRDTKPSLHLRVSSLVGNNAHAGFVPFCTLLELTVITVSSLSHLCKSLGFVHSSLPAQLGVL